MNDSKGPVYFVAPTLRDYFAAHAPEQMWPHFKAAVPPRPEAPSAQPIGNDGQYPTDLEERNLTDWRRDAHWDIDEDLPNFSNWCAGWRAYWKAKQQWEDDQLIARREQWPWFYADAMMRGRMTAPLP